MQLVICNRSGSGAAASVGDRLARELRRRGYRVRIRIVDDLRRARTDLVREARDRACLVGLGGDDTLSQLARVAHEARVPLLPVPTGFANIFAGAFGIRPTVSAVTDMLEHGRVELVDAGLFGGEFFLSNQGFGLLTQVQTWVETSPTLPQHRWRRYGHYVRASLRALAKAPLPVLGVELDGRSIADRAPIAIVANVPTYRTFLPLVTDADPFDGLLDVFIAPEMSKCRLIGWLLRILLGVPGCRRAIVSQRASRVTIAAGYARDEIVVVPRAVPVLLPRACMEAKGWR